MGAFAGALYTYRGNSLLLELPPCRPYIALLYAPLPLTLTT